MTQLNPRIYTPLAFSVLKISLDIKLKASLWRSLCFWKHSLFLFYQKGQNGTYISRSVKWFKGQIKYMDNWSCIYKMHVWSFDPKFHESDLMLNVKNKSGFIKAGHDVKMFWYQLKSVLINIFLTVLNLLISGHVHRNSQNVVIFQLYMPYFKFINICMSIM